MKLLDHLPDILRDIYEFRGICSAGDNELEALKDALAEVVNDNFVRTLSENGCSRWERMLKLTPKATDTLDDRRFRILAAINQDTPYTMRGLHVLLSALCGADEYSAELDPGNYTISVKLALTAKEQFSEVQKLLAMVLPANIASLITLKYNRHMDFTGYTHGELAAFTHDRMRNEVLTT